MIMNFLADAMGTFGWLGLVGIVGFGFGFVLGYKRGENK